MPEQKVSSLGQSQRSSKCQSKRLPPLGKATARANARPKGYLPWAKPPLEQMPEQKVTFLSRAGRLPTVTRSPHNSAGGRVEGRPLQKAINSSLEDSHALWRNETTIIEAERT